MDNAGSSAPSPATGRWRWALVASGLGGLGVVLLLVVPSSAPFVVALIAALGATAWQAMRGGRALSPEQGVRAALLLVCVGGVVLPAAVGAAASASALVAGTASGAARWLVVSACAACAVATVAVARGWPERRGDALFLGLVGLLFLAAKLLYVQAVETPLVSDFAGMWRMADRLAEEGAEALPVPRGFSARIHFERILPFLLPARLLFGPGSSSYEVPNVLAGLATSLVAYGLARSWFGRPAGRIAFVVANLSVETWLAAALPTHDVPGALFTLVALALWVLLERALRRGRYAAAVAASLGAGASLLVVDLQRTTGALVLLPAALVAGLAVLLAKRQAGEWQLRTVLADLTLVAALPALVLVAGGALLAKAELTVPGPVMASQTALVTAAHTDSWAAGRYSHYRDEWAAVYGRSGLVTGELVVRKVLSDVRYSPLARIPHWVRKSARLYTLGRQMHFYLRGATVGGDAIEPRTVATVAALNRLFVVVFLAALVVAALTLWGASPPPLVSLLPIVYLSTLSAALILVGEVQPRYLYQIWFIAPIYVGRLLGGGTRPRASEEPQP